MFEGQSLAFVYGYRPCEAQRILSESALHFGLNLFRPFVQRVFRVLPCLRLHLDGFIVSGTQDNNLAAVNVSHVSDASVVVASVVVVADEHHLCPLLQGEVEVGRVAVFRKVSVSLCSERAGF